MSDQVYYAPAGMVMPGAIPELELEPSSEGQDFADVLLSELDRAGTWPLEREKRPRATVTERRAFRISDRETLKRLRSWDMDRPYIHDSLARRIAFGFADFLFADDPEIVAADARAPEDVLQGRALDQADQAPVEPDLTQGQPQRQREPADQERLDTIIEENRLSAKLHRAARLVVSEGEAWWKLHVNRAVAPCALLTWNSRLDVVPLFYADRVLAVGFVTERAREDGQPTQDDKSPSQIVWRHIEIHTAGRVLNVLYEGTDDQLGARRPLTARQETAGYAPVWVHGLPMLAGRVVNDLDEDETLGSSDFEGVKDELYALDEAVSTIVENTRLSGQDRVAVAGPLLTQDNSFDASLQVLRVDAEGGTLGEDPKNPPIVPLPSNYDPGKVWLHIANLTSAILSRVGLVAEFLGGDQQAGKAETGTAIRLRFLPTTNAASGKLREWRHDLPRILWLMLRVDALDPAQGGFGTGVVASEPPSIEFGDIIPVDDSRTVYDLATAVAGEFMSRRTAIIERHPDWTPEQVQAELAEIEQEMPRLAPVVPPRPPSRNVIGTDAGDEPSPDGGLASGA